MVYNVSVLVVSDSCYENNSLDRIIPKLKDLITQYGSYKIQTTDIVPDSTEKIQSTIKEWTNIESKIDLIVTCGGTGFTKKDITPESVKPLIDKETPGITQLMIQESLKITPMAIMSRPVTGIINQTLIVTLPGSPKAAAENLSAIIPNLSHAIDQLSREGSRDLHANPDFQKHHQHAERHNCSHTQGSGLHQSLKTHKLLSNDTSKPVTRRARQSQYPMIPVQEAYDLIQEHTPKPRMETKTVCEDLKGFILAEDVFSLSDVPAFKASIVDGYAVVADHCSGILDVVSVSHASPIDLSEAEKQVSRNKCARITTGAPLPVGADSVIMVEETEIAEISKDEREEVRIKNFAMDVEKGDNVREVGSDVKKGELLLEKGHLFSSIGSELGLLISCGIKRVKVYKKPLIGVMSTGDELIDVRDGGNGLLYGQVYDSNRPILISNIKNLGFRVVDLGIAKDKLSTLTTSIENAFQVHNIDYLITTGGVSMGELDLLKPTIERELKGTVHFGRVNMKPGKPTTFATIPFGKDSLSRKIIFALPGNPVSASVTFNLFVLSSVYTYCGYEPNSKLYNIPTLPIIKVVTNQRLKLDSRPEYQRAFVYQDVQDNKFKATTTGFQRSSRISSLRKANGLLMLPSSNDGVQFLEEGTLIDAMMIDSLL